MMKRTIFKKAAAAALAGVMVVGSAVTAQAAGWQKDDTGWRYYVDAGDTAGGGTAGGAATGDTGSGTTDGTNTGSTTGGAATGDTGSGTTGGAAGWNASGSRAPHAPPAPGS